MCYNENAKKNSTKGGISVKNLFLLLVLCLLLCSCQNEADEMVSTPAEEPQKVEEPAEESPKEVIEEPPVVQEEISQDWPYPAVDMSKPITADAEVLKYFEYFNDAAAQVVFLEEENGQLTDKSISVYSYLELCRNMGEWTIPLADMDETCMKFFGRIPSTYNSSMLEVDTTENTVSSTGWGGWSLYYMLKEKEELPSGQVRLLFETIDTYDSSYEWPITWEEYRHAVLSRQWECLPAEKTLTEMILTEKTDEDGAFYVQYHSVHSVEAES